MGVILSRRGRVSGGGRRKTLDRPRTPAFARLRLGRSRVLRRAATRRASPAQD